MMVIAITFYSNYASTVNDNAVTNATVNIDNTYRSAIQCHIS